MMSFYSSSAFPTVQNYKDFAERLLSFQMNKCSFCLICVEKVLVSVFFSYLCGVFVSNDDG